MNIDLNNEQNEQMNKMSPTKEVISLDLKDKSLSLVGNFSQVFNFSASKKASLLKDPLERKADCKKVFFLALPIQLEHQFISKEGELVLIPPVLSRIEKAFLNKGEEIGKKIILIRPVSYYQTKKHKGQILHLEDIIWEKMVFYAPKSVFNSEIDLEVILNPSKKKEEDEEIFYLTSSFFNISGDIFFIESEDSGNADTFFDNGKKLRVYVRKEIKDEEKKKFKKDIRLVERATSVLNEEPSSWWKFKCFIGYTFQGVIIIFLICLVVYFISNLLKDFFSKNKNDDQKQQQ